MKKFLLILGAVFLFPTFSWAQTQEIKDSTESHAIKGMLLNCLPAVVSGEKPAEQAKVAGLLELPAEKTKMFIKDGRAFAVPNQIGNAVLLAPNRGGCSVNIRRLDDYDAFWELVQQWFGEETPFKNVSKKTEEGGYSLTKVYEADFNGKVVVLVSARKNPHPTGVQAVLTAARIKE